MYFLCILLTDRSALKVLKCTFQNNIIFSNLTFPLIDYFYGFLSPFSHQKRLLSRHHIAIFSLLVGIGKQNAASTRLKCTLSFLQVARTNHCSTPAGWVPAHLPLSEQEYLQCLHMVSAILIIDAFNTFQFKNSNIIYNDIDIATVELISIFIYPIQ